MYIIYILYIFYILYIIYTRRCRCGGRSLLVFFFFFFSSCVTLSFTFKEIRFDFFGWGIRLGLSSCNSFLNFVDKHLSAWKQTKKENVFQLICKLTRTNNKLSLSLNFTVLTSILITFKIHCQKNKQFLYTTLKIISPQF